MSGGKFATSVTCMDGRIQIPLIQWIKDKFSIDYVDTITEPGMDKKIAEKTEIDSVKKKVLISVNAHKSSAIIISGHFDCAGNPVSPEEHIKHIKASVREISQWDLGVQVIGAWVDDKWDVRLL